MSVKDVLVEEGISTVNHADTLAVLEAVTQVLTAHRNEKGLSDFFIL
jgi:hypothetical protein